MRSRRAQMKGRGLSNGSQRVARCGGKIVAKMLNAALGVLES